MYSIVKIRTPMGILTAIASNRDKKIEEEKDENMRSLVLREIERV